MPPGEDEEFPNLAEMQPPMAIDIPAHMSLLCRALFIAEPGHKPCSSSTCGGHGTGQLCSRQPCGCLCLCYCHAWPATARQATPRRRPGGGQGSRREPRAWPGSSAAARYWLATLRTVAPLPEAP